MLSPLSVRLLQKDQKMKMLSLNQTTTLPMNISHGNISRLAEYVKSDNFVNFQLESVLDHVRSCDRDLNGYTQIKDQQSSQYSQSSSQYNQL